MFSGFVERFPDTGPELSKAFEKLKTIDGSAELSEFHVARIKLAKGDREAGKTVLAGERSREPVPTCGEHVTAVGLDSPPHDHFVASKGGAHPIRRRLPQSSIRDSTAPCSPVPGMLR